jgi:hypothetical protein
VNKKVFYTFGDSDEDEPYGLECVCIYGESIEEALAANAQDKIDDEKDGGKDPAYWDTLKLFRVTVEEIPRLPQTTPEISQASAGGNAKP